MTAFERPADQAAVDQIGWVCHAANRAFQQAVGDARPSPEWPDDWEREATEASVRRVLAGATPEELHTSWCDLKYKDGWRYGERKDPDAKTHPCLVPYEQLPERERRKDALFHAIVRALAGP
ncbi:RyR domain-containing protein [Catenuloplanes sp. NPDC051500]|uniref:RyR domain-containing protein n=1 Tax=Catenuloplanes sp. NPDC051500 TaxID=3363959 RepID=UPI00378C3BD3